VPKDELSFLTRLWFAWICFFRVLFDRAFAERVWKRERALPEPAAPKSSAPTPTCDAALQLLALLQREGRLVDFLEQDVTSFSDAEIGQAARVVHEGCRKALRAHLTIAPVRAEDEGANVTLEAGFNPAEVKLSGNVAGSGPYKGTLRHRGWRASGVSLPVAVKGHDASVVAPAEVEI
jgi:hypothetical protein